VAACGRWRGRVVGMRPLLRAMDGGGTWTTAGGSGFSERWGGSGYSDRRTPAVMASSRWASGLVAAAVGCTWLSVVCE
jgi:hypothetical protein